MKNSHVIAAFIGAAICCGSWGGRPASADPFPVATPESQGMSSAALDQVATIIDGYVDRNMLVGAEFVVIKNRRTVLHRTFGWKDREGGVPMPANTIFNVRSMTKPFTGAAAHVLIDDGLLGLTDTPSTWIPGFDNDDSRAITIEQLLTHRSGLPLNIITSVDEYPDLLSLANAIGETGPDYPPGSKFWYSDSGTDTLGAVVEQVSGLPLREFITTHLLEPLGMAESFSQAPDPADAGLWDRVAPLYYAYQGDWLKIWEPDGTPFYPFAWGSQTLFSTPMDYARFLAMWLDSGSWDSTTVLSPDAVDHQLTPVSEMTNLGSDIPVPSGFRDTRVHYGQLAVLYLPIDGDGIPDVVGHSGSDGTWAWAWPEHDLIILYCTQSRGGNSGTRLEYEIDRLLVRPDYEPVVPSRYRRYLGEYLADFGPYDSEPFRIMVHNGHLTLDMPDSILLEMGDPDASGYWHCIFNASVYIYFIDDPDGNVAAMRITQPGSSYHLPRITPPGNDSISLF